MQQIVVEMRLMGRIDISVNGAEVIWKTKRLGKLWGMLCLLAARGEDWVPAGEMARLLWGEKNAEKARNDVKSAVSHLRRELAGDTGASGDDVIEYGNGGYRLGPAVKLSADFVEIREIYRKLETRHYSLDRRLNQCRRLAELYRGNFYCGDGCPNWMEEYSRDMAESFVEHMSNCGHLLTQAGRYEDVVDLHKRMGEDCPICDGLVMEYYQALEALGLQDVILRQFDGTKADFEKHGKEYSRAFAEVRRIAAQAIQQQAEDNRLLEQLRADLSSEGPCSARVLDYPQLKRACRQNPGRYTISVFTLRLAPGAQKDGVAVRETMDRLIAAAVDCLGGHDIVTPYSENQLLVVMPNHSLDESQLRQECLYARLAEQVDPEQVFVKTEMAAI